MEGRSAPASRACDEANIRAAESRPATLDDFAAVAVGFEDIDDLVSEGLGDLTLLVRAGADAFFVTDKTFSAIDDFLPGGVWAALVLSSCSRNTSKLRLLSFSSWASFAREACLAGIIKSGAMGSGLFGIGLLFKGRGDRGGIGSEERHSWLGDVWPRCVVDVAVMLCALLNDSWKISINQLLSSI